VRALQIRFDDPWPDGVRRMDGLSVVEAWGRWTEGARARIELAAPWRAPARLALEIRDVFGPNVGKALVLRVGHRTHLHTLRRGAQRIRLSLPAEDAELSRIELEIPAPESPLRFGCGTDPRKLGVGLDPRVADDDVPVVELEASGEGVRVRRRHRDQEHELSHGGARGRPPRGARRR